MKSIRPIKRKPTLEVRMLYSGIKLWWVKKWGSKVPLFVQGHTYDAYEHKGVTWVDMHSVHATVAEDKPLPDNVIALRL